MEISPLEQEYALQRIDDLTAQATWDRRMMGGFLIAWVVEAPILAYAVEWTPAATVSVGITAFATATYAVRWARDMIRIGDVARAYNVPDADQDRQG